MNQFSMRRTWGPEPKFERVLQYMPTNYKFTVIAGPCSVESVDQIHAIAKEVASTGATHLRGGVFRAGTYPGKNFGLINSDLIHQYYLAAQENGLLNIVEVLNYDIDDLNFLEDLADCFQVGARSMQNYQLLNILGQYGKPIFLKRHPGCSIDEWLGAAEYLLSRGAKEIYLIERGSVSHMKHVRWDLSISAIAAVREICKIPVIVDASHGTGRRDLVAPMTLAGVAAGADGVLVETHTDPENSLSDADQAIHPIDFYNLMLKVKKVREAIK